MRFAMSAAAAASGLVLLGLAVFGQPDLYVRLAREQWDSLMAVDPSDPAPEPTGVPPSSAEADRLARLQQEVTRLRDQLAANQSEADRAREALAAAEAQRQGGDAPAASPPEVRETTADAVPERHEATPPPVPERRDTSSAERRDSTPPERREASGPDRHDSIPPPERREPAKAIASVPRPVPPRQEAENAQSVLARLRQISPGSVSAADAPRHADRTRGEPSSSLRRLIAARAALAAGRIDDARRQLQEIQLQLVFRPIGSTEDESASSGRAASDVARALDALSGNDLGRSRDYIGRAMDDASGGPGDTTDRETVLQGSGYAPAYPVH